MFYIKDTLCPFTHHCAGLPMHIYQMNNGHIYRFSWELSTEKMAVGHPHFHCKDVWKWGIKDKSMGAVHWEEAVNDPAVWSHIRAGAGRTSKSSRVMLIWEVIQYPYSANYARHYGGEDCPFNFACILFVIWPPNYSLAMTLSHYSSQCTRYAVMLYIYVVHGSHVFQDGRRIW